MSFFEKRIVMMIEGVDVEELKKDEGMFYFFKSNLTRQIADFLSINLTIKEVRDNAEKHANCLNKILLQLDQCVEIMNKRNIIIEKNVVLEQIGKKFY